MGLIHQTNGGFIGNRGVSQTPSSNLNLSPKFYLPGNSYTDIKAGLTGSVTGNVSIVNDNPFGHAGAKSFDFSGGILTFANSAAHRPATDYYTISWWMKWHGNQTNTAYQVIFARRGVNSPVYQIHLKSGSNDKWISSYDGTNIFEDYRVRPPLNTWVHMLVKGGPNGEQCTFMNGIKVLHVNGALTSTTVSNPLHIGSNGNEYFHGQICDWAFFDSWPSRFGTGIGTEFEPLQDPVEGGSSVPPGVQQIDVA